MEAFVVLVFAMPSLRTGESEIVVVVGIGIGSRTVLSLPTTDTYYRLPTAYYTNHGDALVNLSCSLVEEQSGPPVATSSTVGIATHLLMAPMPGEERRGRKFARDITRISLCSPDA